MSREDERYAAVSAQITQLLDEAAADSSPYGIGNLGSETIWNCICGEQLEMRHFADDAGMSHTSCGNCGESWWISWRTEELHHGTIEEALIALRKVPEQEKEQ